MMIAVNTIAMSAIPSGDVFFRFVIRMIAIMIGRKIAPRRAARSHDGGFGSRAIRDFDELDVELLEPEAERVDAFAGLPGSTSSGSTSFPAPSR